MCGNDCKGLKKKLSGRKLGFWSGILLFLVPKCPFCFMAFSSVLVICGESGTAHSNRTFYSTTTLILSAVFCITALFSILLYYRPNKSKFSLMMAIPGILALLYSVTWGGGLVLYYAGAFLVLAGLIRNSGLWALIENKRMLRNKQVYDAFPEPTR